MVRPGLVQFLLKRHASYLPAALAALVASIPVWRSARLPTMDGPQHLLLAQMAARFDDPAYGYDRFFVHSSAPLPSTLDDLLLRAMLSLGLSAPLAQKLFVTLVIVLLAAALAYACAHRDERNAVFAAPGLLVVHGLALGMGFFAYLISIPLGLAALGVALRTPDEDAGARRYNLACGGLLALSVLAHPFVCGALLPAFLCVAWGKKQRPVRALLPLLPALAVAGGLFLVQASFGAPKATHATVWTTWRQGLDILAFDGFRGVAATGVVGLVGALVVAGPGLVTALRSRGRLALALVALAGLYAACSVFLPGAAFNWAVLQHRFVPLFWIVTMLVAAQAPFRYGRLLVAGAMVALAAQCFQVARKNAVIDEGIADYRAGVDAVPRGVRLLPLNFSPRGESQHWLIRPYLHAWSWILIERGGMTPYVFAMLPIHAFQFKDRPAAPPEFLDNSYSCASHGITGKTPECDAFKAARLRAYVDLAQPYDAVITWRAPVRLGPLLEARGFRLAHSGVHSAVYVANRAP